jgi:hypothetical protein
MPLETNRGDLDQTHTPHLQANDWNIFLPMIMLNGDASYPPGEWDRVIDGQEFTETLTLDTGDDNILIVNAVFHDIDGNGIMIRNVKNIYIKDCLIYDLTEEGIALSSSGSTENVTIDGCTIHHTARSGIIAKQRPAENVNHINLVIKNNTIYDTGQSEYDHGIYVQSTDSLIERNVIHNSSGNGISLRSSGIVRGNEVWATQESCIRYYSDNVPGRSNAVVIENNICYQLDAGAGDPGISLLRARETAEAWLVQNYTIRFNTVVMFTADRANFAVESAEIGARHVQVYGNLFINTRDLNQALPRAYVDYLSSNYTSTSLAGFVNAGRAPYDFRLMATSPARRYAAREPNFPVTDINGTVRTAGYLDAGAHQFSTSTN